MNRVWIIFILIAGFVVYAYFGFGDEKHYVRKESAATIINTAATTTTATTTALEMLKDIFFSKEKPN